MRNCRVLLGIAIIAALLLSPATVALAEETPVDFIALRPFDAAGLRFQTDIVELDLRPLASGEAAQWRIAGTLENSRDATVVAEAFFTAPSVAHYAVTVDGLPREAQPVPPAVCRLSAFSVAAPSLYGADEHSIAVTPSRCWFFTLEMPARTSVPIAIQGTVQAAVLRGEHLYREHALVVDGVVGEERHAPPNIRVLVSDGWQWRVTYDDTASEAPLIILAGSHRGAWLEWAYYPLIWATWLFTLLTCTILGAALPLWVGLRRRYVPIAILLGGALANAFQVLLLFVTDELPWLFVVIDEYNPFFMFTGVDLALWLGERTLWLGALLCLCAYLSSYFYYSRFNKTRS